MARVTFEFDPDFDNNLYHASNKSRSSLSPLFNTVRNITDNIAKEAKNAIQREWYIAENEATSNRDKRFDKNHNDSFLVAKARAFALKSGYQSVAPTMGVDSQIFGRVTINRTGSTALEYGGIDVKAEIGRGTGNYVVHPAYAFLRNAMHKAGG
jgi:hypothetical protein